MTISASLLNSRLPFLPSIWRSFAGFSDAASNASGREQPCREIQQWKSNRVCNVIIPAASQNVLTHWFIVATLAARMSVPCTTALVPFTSMHCGPIRYNPSPKPVAAQESVTSTEPNKWRQFYKQSQYKQSLIKQPYLSGYICMQPALQQDEHGFHQLWFRSK